RDPRRVRVRPGERLGGGGGGVRVQATPPPAVEGVAPVVSAGHRAAGPGGGLPAPVGRGGRAKPIAPAAPRGAAAVVVLGGGASADSPMELFRMKHAAEQRLRASGITATIVRSTAFMETWVALLRQTAARSGRPLVFGRGDNPINFVSVIDVAALAERAITDP